jgi:hypothetical protein
MPPNETKFIEHLAFRAELSLEALCEIARTALDLPPFCYDGENQTEWGIAVKNEVEYNISRPYKEGTLQEWDRSVPEGCNFGMILIVSPTSPLTPETVSSFVVSVGQTLSNILNTTVWYHCHGPVTGKKTPPLAVFVPAAVIQSGHGLP